jgi:4-diphosphocytidyl-2-C-methyl-D-erythritol kinase
LAGLYEVLAPAKINLVLEVGPRRPDGYHELATVFQAIGLYDKLTMVESRGDMELVVSGALGAAGLSDGRDNLVWRAARLLAAATSRARLGASVCLGKNIPIAAGLGGGSSDAAATLRLLARAWNVQDDGLLYQLAAELGSDVPFFLRGGSAMGRGRGEQLTPLHLPALWFALANPGVPSSTAGVYGQLAGRRAAEGWACSGALGGRCQAFVEALREGGPEKAGARLHNDLADAALTVAPAAGPLMEAFERAGALGVQICGSGPTVFALAADAAHAQSLERQIRSLAAWSWWGCSVPEGGETDVRRLDTDKAR